MATEPETTEETPLDNFDDEFSRIAALAEDAPAAEPEKPAETPAEPEKAEAAPAEEPAQEPEKAEEPAKSAANDDADEVLERLARLVKESAQPAPQEREQPPQQPPQQEQQIFTAEEAAFVQNYEKEWPDVAKAEALRRRAEYKELVSYVFGEVAKELRPLVETVHTISQRTHLSDLKSTVQDYDDVRDKVVDWVEKQPTYLQVAYKHVIDNGSVDEVADLIDRYKRETGVTAAPKAAAAPVARKAESELPSATKQAAAALAPVSSKRSAVLQASDPDDFESAFAAFASKL